PYRPGNCARCPAALAARALKCHEVVCAHEKTGRAFHSGHVERLGKMPGIGTVKRVRYRGVPDPVLIRLRASAEPGMEVFVHLSDRQHSDIGRKLRVERTMQRGYIVIETHDDAGNLTERVSARISTPGAVHRYARSLESRECLLQQTLHGLPFGLPLP